MKGFIEVHTEHGTTMQNIDDISRYRATDDSYNSMRFSSVIITRSCYRVAVTETYDQIKKLIEEAL